MYILQLFFRNFAPRKTHEKEGPWNFSTIFKKNLKKKNTPFFNETFFPDFPSLCKNSKLAYRSCLSRVWRKKDGTTVIWGTVTQCIIMRSCSRWKMFRRWQLEVDCRGIMGTRLQKSQRSREHSCIFSCSACRDRLGKAAAKPSWAFPNSFFAYAYNSAWLLLFRLRILVE